MEAFSQNEFDALSPVVIAKIYLNIALIKTQTGHLADAVVMHEMALDYKLKGLPTLSEEIRD